MIYLKALLVAVSALLSVFYPPFLIILIAILLITKKGHLKYFLILTGIFIIIGISMRFIAIPFKDTNLGIVIKTSDNYLIFQTFLGKYYIPLRNHDLEVGDILRIRGQSENIVFNQIEKSFDFAGYLRNLGVKYQINQVTVDDVLLNPIRPKKLFVRLSGHYNDHAYILVKALIFNDKDYENELMKNFKSLDMLFLLSSSGLHIYALNLLIEKITSIFTDKKIELAIIPLLFLIPLFLLNLGKFIFYRIFLVKTFRYVNSFKLNDKFSYLEVLCLSALGFLIINPFLIFSMSFTISFGLSFFTYFSRPLFRRINRYLRRAAQFSWIYMFLLPIRIYQNYQVMPVSILSQIIMTPILSAFFLLAYLSVLMGGRGTLLLNPSANVIFYLSNIFEPLTFGVYAKELNIGIIIAIYASFFILILLLEIKHVPLLKTFKVALTFTLIYVFFPYEMAIEKSITFINVGQGDSTLIRNGNKTILIDTGGSPTKDIAQEALIPFFRSKKIYRLDAVIITHDDFDHSGALISLIDSFPVSQVIESKESFPFTLADLTINNLNMNDHYEDTNEQSLILEFDFIGLKWLLMGDASINNERELMRDNPDLKVDMIKIGHHGSSTSSDPDFLNLIQAKEGIISCGFNNIYGHPHKEVINHMNDLNMVIRRTDLEGSIVYKSSFF